VDFNSQIYGADRLCKDNELPGSVKEIARLEVRVETCASLIAAVALTLVVAQQALSEGSNCAAW
jgi:hypothetical protein